MKINIEITVSDKTARMIQKWVPGRRARIQLFTLLLGIPVALWAAPGAITKPFTFSAGTVVSSAQVNSDFDTLYTKVNDNDVRLTASEKLVKSLVGGSWVTILATISSLQSITVTPPAAGTVTIFAAGTITLNAQTGATCNYCLDLGSAVNTAPGCTPMAGSKTATRGTLSANFNGGAELGLPYNLVETVPVAAGGTYTLHLNGSSNCPTRFLFHPTMTAIFSPAPLP